MYQLPEAMAESTADSLQYDYPILDVVCVNGKPVWRIRGFGMVVHEHCGRRAWEVFRAECASHGLPVPE